MPWTFVHAWDLALTVISWYENLPSDEHPPREIWHDNDAVEAHFAKIRSKRERESSSGYDEAEEGTLEDARMGRDVTLTNSLVDQIMSATVPADDDFSVI